MGTYRRIEHPLFQAYDSNGDPLAGGLVYTYAAGTDTPKATYQEDDTENSNPVVLDSTGRAEIYGTGYYKFVLKDSDGVTIWTLDNVQGIGETSNVSIGDYANDFDAAITAIGATPTTLYVNDASTMSTNVTVPATCAVIILKGGSIDQAGNALTFSGAPIFQGGTITNDAALTFSVPFDCPTYAVLSATTGVVYTIPQVIHPEFYGALGDGSTNDSTAIQAAIDDLETAKGGTVQFLSKIYVCNIEAKSYVTLQGAAPIPRGSGHSNTHLKANATGYLITTASTAVNSIAIRNMSFIGLGSATALKGLYFQNVGRSVFEHLNYDNFADEAIYLKGGNVNEFRKCFAQNCLLDTSRAAKAGVFYFNSQDNYISECEATASLAAKSDANLYLTAIMFDTSGSNNFVSNCVGEISDVGFYVVGDYNRFVGCRADLNMGHGWELTTGATHNQFVGCVAMRNSADADDTYDGFNVANFGTNDFVGCKALSLGPDAYGHRYGFYDTTSSNSNRNNYVGCTSSGHQTGWFYGVPYLGSGPKIAQNNIYEFTADDETPSVANGNWFDFKSYTTATDVTDFDDKVPGQIIHVVDRGASRYVKIKHNTSKIITLSQTDFIAARYVVYTFRDYNGVWYQVGDRVGDEVATGTFTLIPEGATTIDSSGGAVTGTLGSGTYIGQIKTIVMTDATTSSTVSITNHQTSDPEVATFNAVDETGVFMWTGTEWITIFATCTFV